MSRIYAIAKAGIAGIYDAFIHTPPVLAPEAYFPSAGSFVRNWEGIRDEAKTLVPDLQSVPQFHELMPRQYRLSPDQKEWRMFVVQAYGLEIAANMRRCPRLAALVNASPDVQTACLSFLSPGKQVPTHTGPFRGITRFYMGLVVPLDDQGRPGVVLTIDGAEYRLGNGDWLLWDDTYPHSVRNCTGQWRIALLLDVYRAGMPGPLRTLTNAVIRLTRASIRRRKVLPDGLG